MSDELREKMLANYSDLPPMEMVTTTDFNHAYAWLMQTIMDKGARMWTSDSRKVLTKELSAHMRIEGDAIQQILDMELHPQYPQQNRAGLQRYIDSFVVGDDAYSKSAEFEYAYGLRAHEYQLPDTIQPVDQVRHARHDFKYANRQCIIHIWIPPVDIFAKEKPCMQTIQVRNLGGGKAIAEFLFRSNDAYKAFQWNMVGAARLVQDQITGPNGARLVAINYNGSCTHVYEEDWDAARRIRYSPLRCD